MNRYTQRQVDIMLNGYLRDHPRPKPWRQIAHEMGVPFNEEALERLLWGYGNGYGGPENDSPRKEYTPGPLRYGRSGWRWWPREDKLLRSAFAGDGTLRDPPCDAEYMAKVLARSKREVERRWKQIGPALGREGFGCV